METIGKLAVCFAAYMIVGGIVMTALQNWLIRRGSETKPISHYFADEDTVVLAFAWLIWPVTVCLPLLDVCNNPKARPTWGKAGAWAKSMVIGAFVGFEFLLGRKPEPPTPKSDSDSSAG